MREDEARRLGEAIRALSPEKVGDLSRALLEGRVGEILGGLLESIDIDTIQDEAILHMDADQLHAFVNALVIEAEADRKEAPGPWEAS